MRAGTRLFQKEPNFCKQMTKMCFTAETRLTNSSSSRKIKVKQPTTIENTAELKLPMADMKKWQKKQLSKYTISNKRNLEIPSSRWTKIKYKSLNIDKPNMSRSQKSTGSANNSSAAPNSVYLAGSCNLSRDLSDLSGSYANGTNRSREGVPRHIYDHQASFKGPWRQAYTLSQVPPNQKENWAFKKDATILVSQNDVVEIVDNPILKEEGVAAAAATWPNGHSRIPVLFLLIDPPTHSYELMQVWVDRSTDSISDLVSCMRQSIPGKWKQSYDGLFQVRGLRFTQLIHILRLLKYDVQPHEILIAKPRTMTAKVT